jgi:serine/threonine protein kinase
VAAATLPPSPLGVIGGRYVVLRRIGGGANGDVYEVDDTYQQEHVALKLLAPGPLGVWAEAAILTGLRDKHILPVRNADVHLGQPYLVTALAAHGTLASVTPPHGVPADQAVRWARQICRGAARTHDAGLLHTDIKPDNAFLDETRSALLGDFGLACLPDPTTGQGHDGGTPETMAPEVCRSHLGLPGGSGATRASDVYSLGATLRHVLTGAFAHQRGPGDPQGLACMAAVAAGPGPSLFATQPHLPKGLCDRIDQAMHPDPTQRPASPTALAALLASWPRPTRSWRRTDEHGPAHSGCWRGSKTGAAELLCCAIPATKGFVIETRGPAGKRVTAACTTAPNAAAINTAVRRAFRGAT